MPPARDGIFVRGRQVAFIGHLGAAGLRGISIDPIDARDNSFRRANLTRWLRAPDRSDALAEAGRLLEAEMGNVVVAIAGVSTTRMIASRMLSEPGRARVTPHGMQICVGPLTVKIRWQPFDTRRLDRSAEAFRASLRVEVAGEPYVQPLASDTGGAGAGLRLREALHSEPFFATRPREECREFLAHMIRETPVQAYQWLTDRMWTARYLEPSDVGPLLRLDLPVVRAFGQRLLVAIARNLTRAPSA